LSSVERERARLREAVIRYEEENRMLTAHLEEQKIEAQELRKHIEIYEEKLS
jgi:predicted RNase H-like nuclease (RuvC/YqgF family)